MLKPQMPSKPIPRKFIATGAPNQSSKLSGASASTVQPVSPAKCGFARSWPARCIHTDGETRRQTAWTIPTTPAKAAAKIFPANSREFWW